MNGRLAEAQQVCIVPCGAVEQHGPHLPLGVDAMILLRAATDDAVRVVPLLGGSLPIAPIRDVLGAPFVVVPIVNPDNNQHAPNENLRMREFRHGVRLFAALMSEIGRAQD